MNAESNTATATTLEELMNSAAGTPRKLVNRDIVMATYVGSGLVSIDGAKSDVALHALDRKEGEPALNFRGEVLLVNIDEDADSDPFAEEGGNMVASFLMAKDWTAAKAAEAGNTTLRGKVVFRVTRRGGVFGGYKVRVGHITGYLPVGQLRGLPNSHDLMGEEIDVNIHKLDAATNTLQFSMRSLTAAREGRFEAVQIGEFIQGTVSAKLNFGYLVDIGNGCCGLAHNRELVKGSSFRVGDPIDVICIAKEEARHRIELSQRKATRKLFARETAVGTTFDGKVVSEQAYGLFVELAPGVCGLLHKSQFRNCTNVWGKVPTVGMSARVRVKSVDDAGERIDVEPAA